MAADRNTALGREKPPIGACQHRDSATRAPARRLGAHQVVPDHQIGVSEETKMGLRFLLFVGCVAAVLVVALPAAANNKPSSGAPIPLGPLGPTTFPANTPFHIEHGFTCPPGAADCLRDAISANAGFDLYLDGVLQPSTVDVDLIDGELARRYLTNYPSGLPAGTYTFVGVHTLDGVAVLTRTKTITFS